MQSKRDQRHGGLSARIGSLAYRAAQRAMTLDVSRLMCLDAANVQCVPVDERFSFRFLNAAEVRAFARDAQNDLTSAFAERMRQGRDLCYAALDGRMLAGYAWLALESIEAEQNRGRSADSGVAASFGSDTAFVYRAFTREEFRGRHLYAACLVRRCKICLCRASASCSSLPTGRTARHGPGVAGPVVANWVRSRGLGGGARCSRSRRRVPRRRAFNSAVASARMCGHVSLRRNGVRRQH